MFLTAVQGRIQSEFHTGWPWYERPKKCPPSPFLPPPQKKEKSQIVDISLFVSKKEV